MSSWGLQEHLRPAVQASKLPCSLCPTTAMREGVQTLFVCVSKARFAEVELNQTKRERGRERCCGVPAAGLPRLPQCLRPQL